MGYQYGVDPFTALADPVRRALLTRMRVAPARVVDLTEAVATEHAISRPAVSRHLRVLVEAGLATADDHGRERLYRLTPAGLGPVEDFSAALRRQPPFGERALNGLEIEVRRTVRERTSTARTPHEKENTA